MKITKDELEFRIKRTLNNFYNYTYTSGEISREETEYYFLVRDFKLYKREGGDLINFRDLFLLEIVKNANFKDEQKDFLYDLIDIISGNCPTDDCL
jgi:hypothetical protein